MAAVISIALQKGGVGKTTTATNLAAILGFKGKKVLLIDLDSQGNATYTSGIDNPEYSITKVLDGSCEPDTAVIPCKYYDLLAADLFLTNIELAEIEPTLLKISIIEPLKGFYDFIVIDTPPALGNLSYTALVASDYVVIPCDPRPFSLTGISALQNTIESIRDTLNPSLKVLGILLIKYSPKTVLNRQIRDMLLKYADQMSTELFTTGIREGIALPESQIFRKTLLDYAKKSNPCKDYITFTEELLEKIGDN